MQVNLYKFSKRPNSTKQPAVNDPTLTTFLDVNLKESCSMLNPVLLFNTNNLIPTGFNYCYIINWNRYYYIRDWTYLNGIWECSLVSDPLASFKSEIGSTSAYIIRNNTTNTNIWDQDITDNFYPATSEVSMFSQRMRYVNGNTQEQAPQAMPISGGCYIIGTLADAHSSSASDNFRVGSVTYYALDQANMNNLMNFLFSGDIYTAESIEDVSEGMFKSMFDPFQYIVSCMWFPFANTAFRDADQPLLYGLKKVRTGYWECEDAEGYPVRYILKSFAIKSLDPLMHHPQYARGKYLDKAPFTKMTLYLPPFGEIPIDTSNYRFGSNTYLWCQIYLDAITGQADVRVSLTESDHLPAEGHDDWKANPYAIFTMRSSQVGVPIQLSKVMTDYVSTMQNGVGAISNLLSGNIAGMFNNIISGVANSYPKASSLGSNGSLIEAFEEPVIVYEWYHIVPENITEFGRPVCKTKVISTLSGYIQCGENDHPFSCTETEKQIINDALKNGFFYE